MNATPLASEVFDACVTALRQQRPHAAMALLAQLDPRTLGPSAAALHAELERRVERSRRAQAETARADSLPSAAFRLLESDALPPLPGTTIVGACMNRQGNLLRVLPSWLDAAVDEIIIVDWSSTEPLWPMLQPFNEPRLRVVRVERESRWILSHAFNVGLRLARHERVYKLDADIQLEPHFFEANRFEAGEFVRGFWKAAVDAGAEDQMYVNGSFGAMKVDLREIGYYDERILTYGWDDSDLYIRLSSGLGRAGRLLALGSLRHLEQDEEQRIAHQSIGKALRYGRFPPTEHENQVNRFHTATMSEWSRHHWSQDYEIEPHADGPLAARRLTNRPTYVTGQRVLAETLAARVLTSWLGPLLPPQTWPHPDSLELARLVRLADRSGHGPRLIEGLRQGRDVHLVRVADPLWRDSFWHTLASLQAHHPELLEALIVVEDEGFCPESPAEDDPDRGLRANAALLDVIEQVVGTQTASDLRRLLHTVTGVGRPCTRWQVGAADVAHESLQLAEEVLSRLQANYVKAPDRIAGTCLVTSLYDERNLIRCCEYLACLELNLRVFETIVVIYEHESGLWLQALQALIEGSAETASRLLLVPATRRPSFDDLFAQQARIPAGNLLAVANADVIFDGTLHLLAQRLGPAHVAVLSRRELPPPGGTPCLVRTAVGTPNIYSADAWLVRTPFRPLRSFDYHIGSFYCDSFINGQFARTPGLKVSNPCLDTHVYHVHDARFNSSDEKKALQREQLERTYVDESARMADADPIKGVPWTSIEQLDLAQLGGHVMPWTPRTLVVDSASGPPSLAALLWLWLLGRQLQWMSPPTRLFARLRPQDACGPFGLLLARIKAAEGLSQLMLDVAEAPGSQAPPNGDDVEQRRVEGQLWLDALAGGGLDALVACITTAVAEGEIAGRRAEIRVDLKLPQDTTATQALLAALEHRQIPHWADLHTLLDQLPHWLAERRLIAPFLPDLQPCAPAAPAVAGPVPRIAFVTSMFRGGAHTRAYLENVAAAAEGADGEIVIVDANGESTDDASVVDRFLAEHPSVRRRFTLLRPPRDPGLYACWRIAIEHARAPLISNANLDDRRSPGHSRRLVQLLQARPDLDATCGALTVVGVDEEGGWFDLVPNQVWFGEPGVREFGYSDLFRRADDGTIFSQNMLHCMPVWRRSLHDRFGWFDEDRYGTSADWAFWLMVGRAGARYALDPVAFGRYFFNPDSHNRRNDANGAKERRIIAELIGVQQDRVIKQ